MYRRRRKIQSYRGTARGHFGGSFKFIVIAVIAIAVVSALITGAVLGKNAEKSGVESFGRHNLTDFGGVDIPDADYVGLGVLRAELVAAAGGDRQDFKNAVNDAEDGNAIAFWANDGEGSLFFATELPAKIGSSLNVLSTVSAEEISELISNEGRLGVAYFISTAFGEEDEAKRIIKLPQSIEFVRLNGRRERKHDNVFKMSLFSYQAMLNVSGPCSETAWRTENMLHCVSEGGFPFA